MKNRLIAATLLVALGGLGGWLVSRVLADGAPPTPGSIYYSGTISNVSGSPFSATSANLHVRLYTSLTAGTAVCDVNAPATPVTAGRFRVALDPPGNMACLDALHATPSLWVEVQVESEIIPREQIGAVPYALEADHAVSATSADRVTRRSGSVSISAGGAFCGQTPPTPGNVGGYRAASAMCRAAAGCGVAAHVCTGDELVRSAVLGVGPTARETQYAAGAWGSTTTGEINDCLGFTSNAVADFNRLWATGPGSDGVPTTTNCANAYPIACCE
jgi:hypothetical protein